MSRVSLELTELSEQEEKKKINDLKTQCRLYAGGRLNGVFESWIT